MPIANCPGQRLSACSSISLSFFLSVCLCLCLSTSVCLCVCLPACSVCLSVCRSLFYVCLSLCLYLSAFVSVCMSSYLPVWLCLSLRLSVCVSVSLSLSSLSLSLFVCVCVCVCGVQDNSAPVSTDQSDVVNKTPKAMGTNHAAPCARGNCILKCNNE